MNSEVPVAAAVTVLKKVFEGYNPTQPIEYGFLDEWHAKNFATDKLVD
ncbi:MAG: hypothetical protein QM764_09265 [Chitinophagaceae bacterium]